MAVLVTGGAGYIGSVVVEELLRDGQEVIICDNLSTGHRQAVLEGAIFVQADLSDRTVLTAIFQHYPIEAVIHMAASSLVSESMVDPAPFFYNNLVNGWNLLESMRANGVKRIVFSSTAAVYGEPKNIPIREDDPLEPTNPYGESKLSLERMLRWYEQAYGLRHISLRYFNAAGASEQLGEDHRPETHLIPVVLQTALGQRLWVEVFGTDYDTVDGTCIRDYIHVTDLALAHVLALKALDEGRSGVYNLGNGDGFSVLQVIETARQVTGREIPTIVKGRRLGDPAILVASSERIRSELNWQPRFADLKTIIRTAWEWLQKHPDGYV
ncbi:MAG: UDP-glucose 4-epimerase GalE [Chloroflexi bacterium]|nr:UDP-glucose 4-epimerase GalE [Chloroflexota bacterium]MCL5074857.1 UDP-glucose 4-epimerase GalE [Chloroflexota bacterium]